MGEMGLLAQRIEGTPHELPYGVETLLVRLACAVEELEAAVEELRLRSDYDAKGLERPPVRVASRCDGCGRTFRVGYIDDVCECGAVDFTPVMSGEPCVYPAGGAGTWSRDGQCVS